MTEEQKRYFLISGIFIFLLLIILDLFILNLRMDQAKDLFYNKHLKYLEQQNTKTQNKIDSLNNLILKEQKKLQEISEQKDKIKAIYVRDEKRIDTLYASQLIIEFDKLFSKNIKK